jgi:subtilisin family serine protease
MGHHGAFSRGAGAFAVFGMMVLFLLACLQISLGGAEAAPAASQDSLEHRKRAAEDIWNELIEGDGKADDHDHWERIVRRTASWYDPYYRDDTSHIVNVQEYYRQVLEEQDWNDPAEELSRLMGPFYESGRANVQNGGGKDVDVQKPIPGRYIVMLDSSADGATLDRTIAVLQRAHRESEGRIRADHITPMRNLGVGFTATMNSKSAELMLKHPFLEVLEEDIAVKRSPNRPHYKRDTMVRRNAVLWNLDRLDQHSPNLDGEYVPEGTGELASIYVIDTGIRYSHEEFEGRAHYSGFDAIDELTGSDRKGSDCHGHGTHCAGTAAGKTYGVAKKANVYSVRALGCSGSGAVSGIVQGMDYIASQVDKGEHNGPVIFSMSLGVRESDSLNAAVQRAMQKGIVAVGASGNQGGDSCDYSPASARVGISVGATDKQDNAVSFSNAGECTDIAAPGSAITSSHSECDTCTETLSGTSMAAPHVAGYMAVLLSLNPHMTAIEAKDHMIKQSTKDVVGLAAISSSLASRTPNRFLYVPQATAQDSDIGAEVAQISSIPRTLYGRP